MEREMIGTVGIAIVASLTIASLILPHGNERTTRILKNDYPEKLVAATSDSVGENSFVFGFAITHDLLNLQVSYRFLYGHNLSEIRRSPVAEILERISTLRKLVPEWAYSSASGRVIYNGTEARYTLHDFSRYIPSPTESEEPAFLIIERDSDVIACFSGVSDLFPSRSAGSLLDATLTRSGNRTHFSRRSADPARALPIDDLPKGRLEFDEVQRDETIEISYRTDAFYTRRERSGAVQVISIVCDGTRETLLFNFIG